MEETLSKRFLQLNSEEQILHELLISLLNRMTMMGQFTSQLSNGIKDEPKVMKDLFGKYLSQIDHIFANNYFNDCEDLSKDLGFDYDKVKDYVKVSTEECLNDDKDFDCV